MPLRGDLDPYSRSKADAEQILGVYPNRVVLRPGIVYGPGSAWWSDRIARLLVAKRLGDLGRNGDGICNLVFVDDVAQAVVRALEVREIAGEAFNLSLPDAPTWNGYFTAYARSLGATPIKRISPQRLAVELKVLAPLLKLGEMAGRIGPLRKWQPAPAIRPWLTTLCRHEIRMSVERADSRLGMRWTPLEQGLETTARWFLAGGRA
jgi:nucleoside-diphosphate-sugar epimerase